MIENLSCNRVHRRGDQSIEADLVEFACNYPFIICTNHACFFNTKCVCTQICNDLTSYWTLHQIVLYVTKSLLVRKCCKTSGIYQHQLHQLNNFAELGHLVPPGWPTMNMWSLYLLLQSFNLAEISANLVPGKLILVAWSQTLMWCASQSSVLQMHHYHIRRGIDFRSSTAIWQDPCCCIT